MRKLYTICVLSCCLLFGCTDGIGDPDFEKEQEREYTVFIPEAGTFDFQQKFSVSTSQNSISTSLKVISNNAVQDTVNYEIISFKDNNWSYESIAFVSRDAIKVNQAQFKIIDTVGGTLLNDNNIYIGIFEYPEDAVSISGHYEGTGRLLMEDGTSLEAVFNVYGTINTNRQLLLMPVGANAGFDYVRGTYLASGEFSGSVYKDGVAEPANHNDLAMYDFTYPVLQSRLNLKIDNVTKILELNLTQINP